MKQSLFKYAKQCCYVSLFAISIMGQNAFADQCCEPIQDCCAPTTCCAPVFGCCNHNYYIEGKASAFFPFNNKVGRIYSHVLPQIDVEVGAKIWNNIRVWADVGYLWDHGRSIGEHDKTTLELIPLSFGFSYVYPVTCNFDVYLGAGPSYNLLRIRDHSHFVHEHVKKNAWGGIVKTGIYYHYNECVYFDLTVDYTYQYFRFKQTHSEPYVERHNANLSGMHLGAGIGILF